MSLIDVLSEVYNKIAKLLGPSPFHSQSNMMGPLGQLTPLPGVSYLFTGENMSMTAPTSYFQQTARQASSVNFSQVSGPGYDQSVSSSLWGIANASLTSGPAFGGGLSSPPATNWTPSLGEMVLKIDSKLKVSPAALPVILAPLTWFAF
jgi:hypothetical protein